MKEERDIYINCEFIAFPDIKIGIMICRKGLQFNIYVGRGFSLILQYLSKGYRLFTSRQYLSHWSSWVLDVCLHERRERYTHKL